MASTTAIRGLGEVALRVTDMARMRAFYHEVLGLPILREFDKPASILFQIADGYRGHTRILALFDRSAADGYAGLDARRTTLDHLAFEIGIEDHEPERRRLEALGLQPRVVEFPRWGWRSLFFEDPEGNRVELVAADPDMPRAEESGREVK